MQKITHLLHADKLASLTSLFFCYNILRPNQLLKKIHVVVIWLKGLSVVFVALRQGGLENKSLVLQTPGG